MPYLKLFHGRKDPRADLNDWGEPGPIFGPIPFFHTTYGAHFRFGDADSRLTIFSDLVYYDGWFYGDWSVFDGPPSDDDRHRLTDFMPGKTEVPERYLAGGTANGHLARYDVHLSVTVRNLVKASAAELEQVDT